MKSGLRFLFRAPEVPEQRLLLYLFSESGLFLAFDLGTSGARNKNLRSLDDTNTPPICGKYGLRNHFTSLESGSLIKKSEQKSRV